MSVDGVGLLSGAEDDVTATEGDSPQKAEMCREYIFKVVVMGSFSTGKTTLIKRLLTTKLPSTNSVCDSENDGSSDAEEADRIHVVPTVGTDFYSMVIPSVLPNVGVRLQMWDTAGLDRYATVDASTFRHSSLIVCLFDATNKESVEEITEHHLARAAESIPDLEQNRIFIVGNKIDLLGDDAEVLRRNRKNRKRITDPSIAFMEDEEDSSSSDRTTTISGASSNLQKGSDLIKMCENTVTREDIQDHILNLFADINYAEVSAACNMGIEDLLRRVCLSSLLNANALPNDHPYRQQAWGENSVAVEQSVLPMRTPTPAYWNPSSQAPSSQSLTGNTGHLPPAPAGVSVLKAPTTALPVHTPASPVTEAPHLYNSPNAGHWRQGITFDLAIPPAAPDDIYSPVEMSMPEKQQVMGAPRQPPQGVTATRGVPHQGTAVLAKSVKSAESAEMSALISDHSLTTSFQHVAGNTHDLDAMPNLRTHGSILDDSATARQPGHNAHVSARSVDDVGGIHDDDDDKGTIMQQHIVELYQEIDRDTKRVGANADNSEKLRKSKETANGKNASKSKVVEMYEKDKKNTMCGCTCSSM